jgi:hypothetical protein
MAEQLSCKQQVVGSNPAAGSCRGGGTFPVLRRCLLFGPVVLAVPLTACLGDAGFSPPRESSRRPLGADGFGVKLRVAAAVVVLVASVVLCLPPPVQAAPVPGTGCTLFPKNNIWNTRVDGLPVDPKSDVWLRTMEAGTTNLHPDFGPPDYGLPFDVVTNRHKTVRISFLYSNESDHVRYPLGPKTPIEGGSDHHALIVNESTCTLYELYDVDWNGGKPTAGSGAVWDLSSNALRPDGWTSADAAGLPILPGLVRYDEVLDGHIRHAIRFTAELTRDTHLWPARHDAGSPDQSYPPMGARFRLKTDFDLSSFTPKARVILRAMQRYGLILADNGANWFFQGAVDDRWRNRLLDQLKSVPASAFEAVDESACMVTSDSGRADCP